MKIQQIKFDDHKEYWHLQETDLDAFNLLVGISGVGKTLITDAIHLICHVALAKDYQLDGIEWKMGFVHEEQAYEWVLKSALIKADSPNNLLRFLKDKPSAQIVYEKVFNVTTQEIIAERSKDFFAFKQENINPNLNKHESIFTLFSEDETIFAIRQAFQHVIFSERETPQSRFGFSSLVNFNAIMFQDFKKSLTQFPLLVKAFFLQKFYQNDFIAIKQYLISLFPSISDLKVELTEDHRQNYKLFFLFKEKDSDHWIPQNRMSSGMFRTLTHLIEISLAPVGSVIVIDEFENSLGINWAINLSQYRL